MPAVEFATCLVLMDPVSSAPAKGYVMVCAAFYERGFGVPSHRFLRPCFDPMAWSCATYLLQRFCIWRPSWPCVRPILGLSLLWTYGNTFLGSATVGFRCKNRVPGQRGHLGPLRTWGWFLLLHSATWPSGRMTESLILAEEWNWCVASSV
jgi:hypothetical protein